MEPPNEFRRDSAARATPRPARPARPARLSGPELGALGEQLACEHFQRLGFRILERNVRTRGGEIDIVAFDGHTLVFVEVKTRRASGDSRAAGRDPTTTPLERLGPRQRARLRRLAAAWLCQPGRRRPHADVVSLDAVGVTVDAASRLLRLDHLEAAW
jgi:putative endonuclease